MNKINELFNYWNASGIMKHKVLDKNMHTVLKSVLEYYTLEDLMEAIELYKQVLYSDAHFYTYKFRIERFFRGPFRDFLPEADPLSRFLKTGFPREGAGIPPPVPAVPPNLVNLFKEAKLKKQQGKPNDE